MRTIFIRNIDTNASAILEQWVSEVTVEEKSAAKKVTNKLKILKLPLFANNHNFLSTGIHQSDHLKIVANSFKFNFHIFPDKYDT